MKSNLLLIVPCYNEQEVLDKTYSRLDAYFDLLIEKNLITEKSQICFVNDGSRDNTWEMIEGLCVANPRIKGIKLSRNFGHQSAVLAGLLEFIDQYDCYITIDADLQDDIEAIEMMVRKYQEGAAIVYGVRNDRTSDTWFKRTTAEGFYKIMRLMGVPVIFNHADFRLIDNNVLAELNNYKEVNLFIRGIIPTIGFKSENVYYKRTEREAGESKYPITKMLSFAWGGITSFSTIPMRMVLWFGFLNFFLSIGIGIFVLITKFTGNTVAGWTSTLLPMAFFSGSNMIAIGLIGEYIGKIYQEVKARPRYIIEKVMENTEKP